MAELVIVAAVAASGNLESVRNVSVSKLKVSNK